MRSQMVVALHFLQKKQNTSHLFSHNILHLNRRKSLFFSSIPRVPTNSSWFTRIAKMSFWWCLGCEKCLWSQEAFVLYFSVDRSRNGEEFIKGSYSCPSQSQKLYLLVFSLYYMNFLKHKLGQSDHKLPLGIRFLHFHSFIRLLYLKLQHYT